MAGQPASSGTDKGEPMPVLAGEFALPHETFRTRACHRSACGRSRKKALVHKKKGPVSRPSALRIAELRR